MSVLVRGHLQHINDPCKAFVIGLLCEAEQLSDSKSVNRLRTRFSETRHEMRKIDKVLEVAAR